MIERSFPRECWVPAGCFEHWPLLEKKHRVYSQYNTMIYSIWASAFLMTRNRVQKSCLKLPGVALVNFVGGDHFNMSQLNWLSPSFWEARMWDERSKLRIAFQERRGFQKLGKRVGWGGFLGPKRKERDLKKLPQQQVEYYWHYEG